MGYGGNTGPNPNSTGANGCVVIKYGSLFETFNYTGSDQTWTVPSGVTSVEFQLLGAGGGKGNGIGGGGGYARGTYTVNPGDTFTIIVGQGGKNQSPTETAAFTSATARRNASFGGGASGQGSSSYPNTWASGGGRSAIRVAGATDDLVTAGGGGGGGYSYGGGPGGGASGSAGCGVYQCGGGGTQSAGGAAGGGEPGVAGIKYAGGYAGSLAGTGTQQSEGGGGGGGYYGGGGGGDNGGGGGGSSYIALLTGGTTVAGSGRTPGVVAPVNSTVPTVSGYAAVGATLSATGGTWTSTGTQSWKWQYSADGVTYTDISGATSTTTTATTAGYYRVVEMQSNMLGTVSATSVATRVQDPVVTNCTPTAGVFTHCRRFNFYGAPQSFTMPSYMTVGQTFQIEAWGGGGGGVCCNYWNQDPGGGAGGYVKTKVTVTSLSETFTVEVGERGQPNDPSAQYGGGGAGGSSTNTSAHGASGGGFSGVFSGSGRTTPIVVVGGGGGASRGVDGSAYAGGGGGSTSTGGQGTNAVGSGRGGTTSAGGARATETRLCDIVATSGSQYEGGRGCGHSTGGVEAGGGGGGGYYGGGGGASYSSGTGGTSNGGGGGGSGYLDVSRALSVTATVGGQAVNAPLSGGRTSDQYVAGIASGGQGYVGTTAGATGGHGMVVFQWAEPPTARPDSKSGAVATAISLTPSSNDTATTGTTINASSVKLCGTGETAPNCTSTSVTVTGEGAYSVSGSNVVFTGESGFVGTSSLTYVIADGRGATAASTVSFTTLAPPTARADQAAGAKDLVLTASPLANDSAAGSATLDASTLFLCGVSPAETAPNCTKTTITVSGEGTYAVSGSTVTFTPIGPGYSYSGTRTLSYVVSDSNAQKSSSTIAFIALPPPATRAVAESTTVAFLATATFTPLTNSSPGLAPADYTTQGGLALNASTFRLCANGETQTNGSTTSCSKTSITVAGEGTWNLDTGTNQVSFVPLSSFTGTTTPMPYAVCNSVTGTWAPSTPAVTCASATLTVTVSPPGAPVGVADAASVNYGSSVSITPLANDTGSGLASSRTYLCSATETAPSCLSTSVNVPGEGTWSLNQSTGVVTFTPLSSFTGSATSLSYVAVDAVGQTLTQTLSATVNAPTAPSGAADTASGSNAGDISFTPLANDTGTGLSSQDLFLCGGSDVAPTCTQTTLVVSGKGTWQVNQLTGAVTFTPEANFVGTAGPLTYSVLDVVGQRTTSTLTATVTAMAAPAAPDLSDPSDTGSSSSDNVTSDSTPEIVVPGVVAGQTVTVTATKGATTVTCTFVASASVSSCDLPAVADGVWSVTATTTSTAGNVSATSVPLSVTVDTAPPSAPVAPDLAATSDTGSSSTDNLTGDTTPSVGVPSQPDGTGVTITADQNGTTVSCSYIAAPAVSACDLPTLADGAWNLTAVVDDVAGNPSPSGPALAIEVDSSAPPAPGSPDLAAASDSGSSSSDDLTNDNTPTIEVPGVTAGRTVTVVATRNGVSVSCTFVASSSTSSCDLPLLADGVWSVSAAVSDAAGNVSAAGTPVSVTVDTAAATPGVPDLAASSDTGSSSSDDVTSDNTPRIGGSGGGTGDTVTIIATKDGVSVSCTFVVGQATGCDLPRLADGVWNVTQTITDAAGNVSAPSAPLKVTVDTATTKSTAVEEPAKGEEKPPTVAKPPVVDEAPTPNSRISNDTTGMTRIPEGTAAVAGMPETGWVKVSRSATEFVVTTSEGLLVSISAKKVVDSAVKFNSRGMPVFYRGDVFRIAGAGLKPSSPASTWLHSDPVKLGELTVATDGSFEAEYPMGEGIPLGDHVAKLNAIAPDGTLRVVEVAVEVIGDDAPVVTTGGDAGAGGSTGDDGEPAVPGPATVALIASALALASLKRRRVAPPRPPAGANRVGPSEIALSRTSRGESDGEEAAPDEGSSAEIASVSAGEGSRGLDEGIDRLRVPRFAAVDRLMRRWAESVDRLSPMFARSVNDGAYLRALTGAFWSLVPLAGALFGVVAALDTDGVVGLPSLWIVVTVVVLGCLDSFTGVTFSLAYAATVAVSGGLDSVAAARGTLGMAVLVFAPALVASAVRPFRREDDGDDVGWNRTVDVVLASLFGAWASGTMFSSVPVLADRSSDLVDRVDLVQGTVLAVLVVRWLLENSVPHLAPRRHREVSVEEFEEPSAAQRNTADLVRTGLFVFVAASFIGATWAVWVGGAFYLVPKIVDRYTHLFPNVRPLHRFTPRDLTRVVVLLFVMVWWAGIVEKWRGDSGDLLSYQFAFMCIPGVVFGVVDWFGRESAGWKSTVVSRVAGTAVLVVGILVVRGVIL